MTERHPATTVIFDLDGTLIDSLPDVVGALNVLLAEESRRPITIGEGGHMVGEGAAAMVERAFAATGDAATGDTLAALTKRYIAHYRTTPEKDTIVYPGVFDVLDRFAADGVAMGVCTNKPHQMSRTVIEILGMERYFRSIIGGDVLPFKKPDPRHVYAVQGEMGVEGTGSFFVGDSATDMAAARNAGLPAVAVSYGYSKGPAEDLDSDILIHSFADLPGAMATLSNGAAGPSGESTR